ncbi:MAG: 5'/3'-nucleotidase SurE [Syntrophaceae bacterium]|nr:5'/3'-nucleotidase SurE [Syntrophaceae bacterium]
MRFLLTNDDGIYAEGLDALCRELSGKADCLVVAPETEQSAVGHAITLSRPLMVRRVKKDGQFWGYAVAGTPADCVKIAIKELSEKPVDLVVSGINLGANAGINVIYSGTVSAATEGAIMGIPSLAISLDTRMENADFSFAARFAGKLALSAVTNGFIRGLTLNVNIPALPEGEIKGIVVTKQGSQQMTETFEKRMTPREEIYYWLSGKISFPERGPADSDVAALKRGMISITPIHYDLTKHDALGTLGRDIADHFLDDL